MKLFVKPCQFCPVFGNGQISIDIKLHLSQCSHVKEALLYETFTSYITMLHPFMQACVPHPILLLFHEIPGHSKNRIWHAFRTYLLDGFQWNVTYPKRCQHALKYSAEAAYEILNCRKIHFRLNKT